jgi:hypothetical protein
MSAVAIAPRVLTIVVASTWHCHLGHPARMLCLVYLVLQLLTVPAAHMGFVMPVS